MTNGDIDQITGQIVDAAMKLHRRLGPGLLESVYETLLAKELTRRGFVVERQRALDVQIDEVCYKRGIRVDLLVNGVVVVEVKSIESIARVHTMQVVTYLRLLNLPVGLLINFGGATLREGLRRIVNDYKPTEHSLLRINRVPPREGS